MKKRILTLILVFTVAMCFSFDLQAASRPARVKNVRASSIAQHSITLKWNKAKRAKYYQIYRITKTYKKNGKTKYKYKKAGTTKKRSFKVKKLSAGKKYKFRIRAVNGKKKGKLSKIKVVKTKNTTASTTGDTTLKIKCSRISDSSFIISWNKIKGAKNYKIEIYKDADNLVKRVTTKKLSYTATGLKSGKYDIWVEANGSNWTIAEKEFTLTAQSKPAESPTSTTLQSFSKEMFALVNKARVANGVAELKWDDELAYIAMQRAKECKQLGYITHDLPTLKDPTDSLISFNYNNCQQYMIYDEKYGVYTITGPMPEAGENMAESYYVFANSVKENAKMTHDGYMNSAGHKRNILDSDFIAVGIATIADDSSDSESVTIYNVELFLVK